jgi:hypothetical protein
MLRVIFRIISKNILTYDLKELDRVSLLIAIDDYITTKSIEENAANDLREEVKKIFKAYIGSEQFVTDQLVKFCRRQKLLRALNDSVDILEHDGDYEQCLKKVDEAVSFGAGVEDGFGFSDLYVLPESYREKYSPEKLVQTGIKGYDDILGGGMAPGEVHCIQAPPKQGKSSLASYIGSNVLSMGKVVFHVTLEIKELDVLIKYAARLSGLTYEELNMIPLEQYQERIQRFKKHENNLFVQYWTEGTANTLNIRSWMSRIRTKKNVSPDLIIIDYDDCLLPVGGATQDMYENSGKIYSDLIGLGDYFGAPVLTFAQPKREAWGLPDQGELIQSYHLAHSAKKAHKCFSLSSLNFKSDSDNGVLYGYPFRRWKSNTKIHMVRDLSR